MSIPERLLSYWAASPLYRRTDDRRLRVLAYHDIRDPEALAAQFAYLREQYQVIDIVQLHRHLSANEPLPPRSVLVTFDDGDRSVYEYGLPLFREYAIPAVLFVITGLLGTEQPFWWEEIVHYTPEDWSAEERHQYLLAQKKKPTREREADLAAMKQRYPHPPLLKRQLTTEELAELAAAGVIIANHTHIHSLLDLTDPAVGIRDIERADTELSRLGYQGRRYFAYPNGNHSSSVEQALRHMGIELAFLFDHRVNDAEPDPLRISRLSVNCYTSIPKLELILSGLHSDLLRLRRRVGL